MWKKMAISQPRSAYPFKKKNNIFLQLRKLGILPPDENLPSSCKKIFQVLWANNGDAISRQYAGTAALKVSVTERTFLNILTSIQSISGYVWKLVWIGTAEILWVIYARKEVNYPTWETCFTKVQVYHKVDYCSLHCLCYHETHDEL